MQALYKSAPGEGNVALIDRAIPETDALNNVRVRVEACAICGMDYHIYHGKFPCTPPFIMGHEFVGIVESIQGPSAGLSVDDRVTAQPHLYACGHCSACNMGLTQFCSHTRSLGIHRDGAMTSYVILPEKYLHRMPAHVPAKLAAITEPFSMVLGNFGIPIEQEKMRTAVVIGAGQVGLLGVAAAKACGAKQVILCGKTHDYDLRFPIAEQIGADVLLNSQKDDIVQRVVSLSDNTGADIVLEASGSESGINAAINMLKPGGILCAMGGTRRDSIAVNWDICLRKALRVLFHMKSNYEYMDRAINLLAAPYTDLSPLITGEFSLNDWQSAFDAIAAGHSVKNVLYIQH